MSGRPAQSFEPTDLGHVTTLHWCDWLPAWPVDSIALQHQPLGMCNLYSLDATRDEVRAYFETDVAWRRQDHDGPPSMTAISNAATKEIYKGQPGLVWVNGELRSMGWGFPHQPTGKSGQKLKHTAVNNARDDKLSTFMWRYSFEARRCLIPATAYAEAEGEKGQMTRTWISAADQPIFACAAIWRNSDEWGPVYSMVTCAPDERTIDIHDRCPVMLRKGDWLTWTEGTPEEAFALLKPYPGPISINCTDELWFRR